MIEGNEIVVQKKEKKHLEPLYFASKDDCADRANRHATPKDKPALFHWVKSYEAGKRFFETAPYHFVVRK